MADGRTIAIVGGGGVGCAIAYSLATAASENRIIVVEKDPSYARASTALAAGGIRQQFFTPENVAMSQFSYGFLERAGDLLAVGDSTPTVGLSPCGYLTMASADGCDELLAGYDMQRKLKADVEWLAPEELRMRFPWMNAANIAGAVLGRSGEGVFDPYALLQAFRRKSRSLGVVFVTDEVVGFERSGAVIDALSLKEGGKLACDIAVNAAGPQAGGVARMVGIDLPVRPYKADTFVFHSQTPIPDCPVVIDPNGLHFRPEGPHFICSMPRRDEWGDDTGNFDVDYGQFDDMLWPALAARVPQFEALKLMRAWAGHLEVNAFDWNPILGLHPDCTNLIFANGFSGHGVQHIPAVGRAIAELITTGRYQTLDLSRLGFARILANEPLTEYGPH